MLATLVALLGAATVAVPLTRRFGLGSVLGYLLAGVAIGPSGLRLVSDVNQIADIASLGVVMLLFLIGLELRPAPPVGDAARGVRPGIRTGGAERRGARGTGTLGRGAVGGRDRAGRGAGDVLHRHRAADAG